MSTRSSHDWKSLPGNFDRVHANWQFHTDNEWGIPTVDKETWVPRWMCPYGTRIRSDDVPDGGAIHFFIDDYRFETVWNRPLDTMESVRLWDRALSPMFSVYHDWPRVIQLWNTYRNRWTQCYWQFHGVRVIPTLAWGKPDTYDFCFAGVPRGCVVATSGVGIIDKESLSIYEAGYREMVDRLAPEHVVFYGQKISPSIRDLASLTMYPTRWDSIRKTKLWLKEKETLASA